MLILYQPMLDLTQGIDHVLNRESTLLLRHNFDQIYNERDDSS